MANIVVIGASRGIGAAFGRGLPVRGDRVWLVSRTRPDFLDLADDVRRAWIRADLSDPDRASRRIARALPDTGIDLLIYNAGIWEKKAFTRSYDFGRVGPREVERIIAVNLTAAILCVQRLLPRLRRSRRARIVLVGSTSGLDNAASREVVYTASKYGLRGLAHALRELLRPDRIGVTCLNPGNVAGAIPYAPDSDAAIATYRGTRMPMHDLVLLVRTIASLSPAACVKEVGIPAMTDRPV